MKIQANTEVILELRSQCITHYENGEPVFTPPRHEAYGTRKGLLVKMAELRNQAIGEGIAGEVHFWTTPIPPSKVKQGGITK